VDFLPKVKIEIIVADEQVSKTMTAILKSTKAEGSKFFISPVEEAAPDLIPLCRPENLPAPGLRAD
jgi:nitrogen regulatory protein PII